MAGAFEQKKPPMIGMRVFVSFSLNGQRAAILRLRLRNRQAGKSGEKIIQVSGLNGNQTT